MAKRAPPKRRGYDYGGQVLSTGSLGQSITSGFKSGADLYKTVKDASKEDKKPDKPATANPANTSAPKLPSVAIEPISGDVGGNARGGKIQRVAGKPIGKDDGLIPAQKGEWVIRKSAVRKLGSNVLAQVNKGKLPTRKGSR